MDVKSTIQTYIDDNGKKIMYGTYNTLDKGQKLLYMYEEDYKHTTFFYKTTGSGGNFLIDINSFCKNKGCIIDNKNEVYINDIALKLHDHKTINLFEEIKKERENQFEKFEKDREREFEEIKKDREREFEIKKLSISDINRRIIIRRFLRRYIVDNGESLRRRGINVKVALFFKKKDLYNNVIWTLENGFYQMGKYRR